MISSNDNIFHLGYRGGSGGFILLHSLLLSREYYTSFGTMSSDSIIKKQWNIVDANQWKSTEIWPDNYNTLLNETTDKKRLLYFCNPNPIDFFCNTNLFKSMVINEMFNKSLLSYNNIKDPQWPSVKRLNDFYELEKWIKKELISTEFTVFNFLQFNDLDHMMQHTEGSIGSNKTLWVYTDIFSQNELSYFKKAYFYYNTKKESKSKMQNSELKTLSTIWGDTLVDKEAVYFLDNTDVQIKLQDFINNPEVLVEMGLINRITDEHIRLLDKWVSLHPSDLLKKVGIHRKPKL